MIFSEQLKYLRSKENLTQEELAIRMGVTRSCIGNYEQGLREPTIEELIALADIFNISLDHLVGREKRSTPIATKRRKR